MSNQAKQEDKRETAVIDGHVYDAETGEYIRPYTKKESWSPTNESDAEFVFEQMLEAKADIVALDSRVQALLENLDALKAQKQRKIDGLKWKYGPALEKIAKDNLPKRGKTWTCLFGKISFRSKAARIAVIDKERAIASLMDSVPDAVKTEVKTSVVMANLPDLWKSEDFDAKLLPEGFERIEASESVSYEVGGGK
jgi:hypothetical protein